MEVGKIIEILNDAGRRGRNVRIVFETNDTIIMVNPKNITEPISDDRFDIGRYLVEIGEGAGCNLHAGPLETFARDIVSVEIMIPKVPEEVPPPAK